MPGAGSGVLRYLSQEMSQTPKVELMASYPQVPASGQRLAIKVDLQGLSE
jgi:hypothetical protein